MILRNDFFFLIGLPNEFQHDDFYKGKFMAAVRLWRKQDEEKRVWMCFSLLPSSILFLEMML